MIFKNLRTTRLLLISFFVYFLIAGYGLFTFLYVFLRNNPVFFEISIFWVVAWTIGLPIYWEKRIIRSIDIRDNQITITRLIGIKKERFPINEIIEARYWPKQKSLNIKTKDKFISYSFEPDSKFYSWIETTSWNEIFIPPTIKRHESGLTKEGMKWSTIIFLMGIFIILITIIFKNRILSQDLRYQIYVGLQITFFTVSIFIVSLVMLSLGRYSVEFKKGFIEFSGMPWDSQHQLFTLEEIHYTNLNHVNIDDHQDSLIYGWGKSNKWIHLKIKTKEGDTESIFFTPKDINSFIHDLYEVYGKEKVFEL